ncbi:MAG: hypothetical protein A2X94_14760 [Bdellovibrionales bacterium GWB1_55_8]|nr:MAG: hypothetical protein A2X94_14760 [Bdellovibrionales bacterium GWB1_55_8]
MSMNRATSKKSNVFLAFALAGALVGCAGGEKRAEKTDSGKASVSLGEERQASGTADVQTKERVVVERSTQIPTVRSTREGADINRMSAEHFIAMGFPEELARNVVEYREEHGPFVSVDQLKAVPGMSEEFFQDHSGKLAVSVRPDGVKG